MLWYKRFRDFLDLTGKRSVLRLYNEKRANAKPRAQPKSRSLPHTWCEAANKFEWRQRADAYDEHMIMLHDAVLERFQKEHAEAQMEIAVEGQKNTLAMLKWPLHRQIVDDDGSTVILEPVGWNKRDAVVLGEYADQVARRLTGQDVDSEKSIKVHIEQQQQHNPLDTIEWMKTIESDAKPKETDKNK